MEAKRSVKLGIFWDEGLFVICCWLLVIGCWLLRSRHPACPVAKRKRGAKAKNLENGSLHADANYKDVISLKKQLTHYSHSRNIPDTRDKFADAQHNVL